MEDVLAAIADIRSVRADASPSEHTGVHAAALRYHLIVIGEAVHHLPPAIRGDAIWRPYLELRNHLAHEYFRIDQTRLSELVGAPLDDLERAALRLVRRR